MNSLPSFTIRAIQNVLDSHAGFELRNNPYFNSKQFIDQITNHVYRNFKRNIVPMITSLEIYEIAELVIINNQLISLYNTKYDLGHISTMCVNNNGDLASYVLQSTASICT